MTCADVSELFLLREQNRSLTLENQALVERTKTLESYFGKVMDIAFENAAVNTRRVQEMMEGEQCFTPQAR